MSIYTQYISEGDVPPSPDNDIHGQITLRPLSGQFDVVNSLSTNLSSEPRDLVFWKDVFARSEFYSGHDSMLFGDVITLVYKNSASKFSAVSITKFGFNLYENLLLDESSRFWPACQNLTKEHRSSYARKVLAISNLKNFNKLWNNRGLFDLPANWDETNAGSLASSMKLVDSASSETLGMRLLSMGLLQESNMASLLVDVVYDNASSSSKINEDNNKLVTILGTQMEQLFDPLLEYSPQSLNYDYTPSTDKLPAFLAENLSISSVINELVTVQTNYTMELVGILQDFIVPLRMNVLSDMSSTTSGVMKVNVVFPPTIDEVTRINCILNNVLKVAAKRGAGEVLRVIASILPFFYKAFARHQANITAFHSRFSKFLTHNEKYSFGNPKINRGKYSPKRLESIILDSIFELPKLKLIVKRLYSVVEAEYAKIQDSEDSKDDVMSSMRENYNTIIQTVDAFGRTQNVEHASKRIFTPSGKLLTELATGWPENLQSGWMTRKVLSIHELENLTPGCENAQEVLIIFSDHLVFLEAVYSGKDLMKVPIPDVLMNSLINQKPLPSYSIFPKLRVKYCCEINSVLCKTFTSSEGQCLSFVSYGDRSFRKADSKEAVFAINYKAISPSKSLSTCNKIMDHICKAQILHKSTPFHLFKRTDPNFTRFYCAHQYQAYAEEHAKSGIVIVLNLSESQARTILNESPGVSVIISLSFYNEDTISIFGYNRESTIEISDTVSIESISDSLKTTFAHCMDIILHSSDFTKSLISSNGRILRQLAALSRQSEDKLVSVGTRNTLDDLVYPDNNTHVAETEPEKDKTQNARKTSNDKKQKSRLFGFMQKLKPKSEKKSKRFSQASSRNSLQNISNTGIPRGRKQHFNKLYKPNPELYEGSTMQSSTQEDLDEGSVRRTIPKRTETERVEKERSEQGKEIELGRERGLEHRVISTATNSSSKYSTGSLDVNSKFEFPMPERLENIQEHGIMTEKDFPELLVDKVRADSAEERLTQRSPDQTDIFQKGLSNKELSQRGSVEKESIQTDSAHQASEKDSGEYNFFSNLETLRPINSIENEYPSADLDEVTSVITEEAQNNPQDIHLSSGTVIQSMNTKQGMTKEQGITEERDIIKQAETKKDERSHVKLRNEEMKMWHGKTFGRPASTQSSKFPHESQPQVAPGKASEIYAKYRMYNEIPSSIFNGDESANWVALARDSYSNLQAELQAIENEADSPDFAKSLENSMKSLYQRYESSNETLSVYDMVSFIKSSFSHDLSNIPLEKTVEPSESYQSLSSNYVKEFEMGLDREFSLNHEERENSQSPRFQSPLNGETEEQSNKNKKLNVHSIQDRNKDSNERENKGLEIKILHDYDFTNSSEEYFSSQVISPALKFSSTGDSAVITSSSSEKTLMNECFTSPGNIKEEYSSGLVKEDFSPINIKKEFSPVHFKEESPPAHNKEDSHNYNWVRISDIDNEIRDFGSMNYLSDLLNGKVQI